MSTLQQPPTAPAPAPRRDSTRVMAIVALVLSVVALVAPVGFFAAPMFLYAFAAGESGYSDLELGPPEDVATGGVTTGASDIVRGPFVAGSALAELVAGGPMDDVDLTCPDTTDVRPGTTILCSTPGGSTYVVVRVTDPDGGYRADWFSPDPSAG
ncbi:hypothetical protein [Arthrobacter sp. NEB 688]|uniref:hypothetical protein n=1 Tax=Arthrobacter sp. NEB 688 TaxID=904039 RepID=UPI0015659CA2|nr:hypothetical protein [Arthrobacter sp. NEB 688]QKE82913.1 hypothetical protein HL663_02385 [Arthrobacter sp. NEB 688]